MAAELSDAERELYQAPFDAFVATRDRLVGELKSRGDKAAASALGKRKRPSISAWAVNQLWWHARGDVDALFAIARRVRDGDLAASGAHRDALAKLRARAAALLGDGERAPAEAVLRRVATTLSAIAAIGNFDPDPAGALVADRDPPGFETLTAVTAPAPVSAIDDAHERERIEHARAERIERDARERAARELRELERARARVTTAEAVVEAARDALANAEAELAKARADLAKRDA